MSICAQVENFLGSSEPPGTLSLIKNIQCKLPSRLKDSLWKDITTRYGVVQSVPRSQVLIHIIDASVFAQSVYDASICPGAVGRSRMRSGTARAMVLRTIRCSGRCRMRVALKVY